VNQGERARLLIGPNALKNKTLREYVKSLNLNDPELDLIAKGRDRFSSGKFTEYKRSLNPPTIDRAKDALVAGHERFGLSKAEADYIAKNAPDQVVESAVYGRQANSNAGPRNWLNASKVTIDPKSTTLSDQAAQAKNVATQQNVEAINSSVTTETGAPRKEYSSQAVEDARASKAAGEWPPKTAKNSFQDQRKVTGAGETVSHIDAQDRRLSNELNGEEYRTSKAGVEASRVNTEFDLKAKAWNAHIDNAADELEKRGKFSNPDGSPKMSNYRRTRFVGGVNPDYPSALTAKEEWILSRQLDYGHIGAAANPSWRYGINWLSNAGPEFRLYNRSEAMSETIYEALAADRALRENKGLTWGQGNKTRFDNILKELADANLSPEFSLNYFNNLPLRDMTPRDLARRDVHNALAAGKDPDGSLLLSGIEPNRMRQGMRSNMANVGQEGAGSVLLLNQSMPMADTENFIAGNGRWFDINATLNPNSPSNLVDIARSATEEQLAQFRKDVEKAGKQLRKGGAGLTPENIAKSLRSVGAASTLMLLSNIVRADGDGGVEKFINGLNWMETQTNQGDEAISNIPGVQAVKDIWSGLTSFLDNNVDTVNVGPGGAIEMPVENVGQSLDAAQNVVNPYWDVAAVTGAFIPDQPQDVVTEQQPYYNGPGFGNYSTIPTPSIVIDEHDAKVNRGMLRNIWTNND